MIDLKTLEIWFLTGSQSLYGEDTLRQVAEHSQTITASLHSAPEIPVSVVFKPAVKSSEEIYAICQEANVAKNCIGVVAWMHTFSPAKMWILGLKILQKPLLHLHTQFNRDIPWGDIDMDFMNLNQSAHGDREFGFIMTRMRINRKVVVGHWQDPEALAQIGAWTRAAAGWHDWQGAKFARFGDNMRYVAVKRLLKQGYGFAGEGDWKTAALVRAMKVMGSGLPGGNAFMEDYTYHFDPSNPMVLGSHMLEVDESLAEGDISCEVHPLGIGGKADPVRLVFNSAPGLALNASLV